MSEWWTYRPADFLMFAPRTYWRLFELHNEAIWPWQAPLLAAALALLALAWRRPRTGLRWAGAALALAWAWVGWAFLWQRYAPINWAAQGFALGFAAQALVLAALAAAGAPAPTACATRRRVALALALLALLGYPLLAPLGGRPAAQAEIFALAPDPTACATLAWLVAVRAASPAGRRLLPLAWCLAAGWCAISAATLWTMGSALGWLPAAAATAALAAAAPRAGHSASP